MATAMTYTSLLNDIRAILALTKRINGGTHGLDDRRMKTKKYAALA